MSDAPAPTRAEGAREDEATRAMIADLERELGVTGTANVFRRALALAKEAAAEVRARQEAYSANDLVYRLRAWGENDPDPGFFTGDLLGGVLMDCGRGSEAIITAEARAARAEAEVARLKSAVEEAQRSYRGLLWEMERGGKVHSVYPQETYRERVAEADARTVTVKAEVARLTAENERMREALKAILKPFPAVTGPAEDMIEDWMSAVSRFRATARAALQGGDHANH